MYQALDPYLRSDTWHTGHPYDDGRFYAGLREIVHHPDFNADQMGDYFRSQKGVSRDNPDDEAFNQVIDKRVTQADAIREFNHGEG